MGKRFEFNGTGGELFGKLFVGWLLTMITFGIYTPWFMASMTNYLYSKTLFHGSTRGKVKMEFTGKGGELFVLFLVGYLLTLVTLGIYAPWFIVKVMRYMADNSKGADELGNGYGLRFNATGGQLFVTLLVGYLLTMVTIGIYAPWFMCKLQKLYSENTDILQGTQKIGGLDFVGTGGSLFVTFLVGYLLTLVTIGIYMPWFMVKLIRFFATNTRIDISGSVFYADFLGTGGQLFVKLLVGYLLTLVTVGIYGFWFMADLLKFQINNLIITDRAPAPNA